MDHPAIMPTELEGPRRDLPRAVIPHGPTVTAPNGARKRSQARTRHQPLRAAGQVPMEASYAQGPGAPRLRGRKHARHARDPNAHQKGPPPGGDRGRKATQQYVGDKIST